MRKTIAYLTLALCLLCLVGFGVWSVICIDDYQAFLAIPGKSGIDYLLVGMPYAIGFILISAVNLVSALVLVKCGHTKFLRVSAFAALGISVLGFAVSMLLFRL